MKNITDKTIALAGIFQAATLVNQIATRGLVDEHDLKVAVDSILNQKPGSTLAVFGRYENLRTGLYTLVSQLANEQHQQRDINVARYVINLLHLERKLAKRPDMLEEIATAVKRAFEQAELFGVTHANVMANLAGIYTDTISQLPPRIMVNGETEYLSNPANADKIRTLLLAGIRAAVLWHQVGASRWQILFGRRHFVKEAKRILDNEMGILH